MCHDKCVLVSVDQAVLSLTQDCKFSELSVLYPYSIGEIVDTVKCYVWVLKVSLWSLTFGRVCDRLLPKITGPEYLWSTFRVPSELLPRH